MNKTTATARPWSLMDDEENAAKHVLHTKRYLVAGNENYPDGVEIIAKFKDGNMADRDFIVKAVNSHEALLEACREAFNFAKTYQANSGDDSLETQEHIDKLFNVINQASK